MDEYSHLPITPGVNFIKKMFSHDQAERAVNSLKINIPETYWNETETYYIYNDPERYNQLTLIKNKKDYDLFKTFESICLSPGIFCDFANQTNANQDPDCPAVQAALAEMQQRDALREEELGRLLAFLKTAQKHSA